MLLETPNVGRGGSGSIEYGPHVEVLVVPLWGEVQDYSPLGVLSTRACASTPTLSSASQTHQKGMSFHLGLPRTERLGLEAEA